MRTNNDSSDKDKHEKLKELILYIANKLEKDPKFGATKLNKILFFSDFIAYAKFGKSITGERYFKLPYGPAPRQFKPVKDSMVLNGEIVCFTVDTLTGPQKRIAPNRPANINIFKPEEIAIVDQVIYLLKDKDASEVSELSHFFMGWRIVKEGKDIPYYTVFIADPSKTVVTERHRKIAEKIAKENGTTG